VTGPVIEVVKGGLIVDIGLRGFLPASLVELRRVRELQPYVGRTIEAKIIELDRNRNNVVLSRRAWLEEAQKEQRGDFLTNLKPGERRKGFVSSVVNFGAFVDLGGMDGLVHVSELSWKHVDHPSSVVSVGDEIEVEVLDVDLDKERISLSLKATQIDPWQEFRERPPGRAAGLRADHQAGAVRCVRAVGDGHRGSGAHLGDGGAPRRPARAGRQPGRRALGEDHRHRPCSAAGSACRSSRRPRAARSPRSTARLSGPTPTTPRATTSATTTTPKGSSRPRPRRRAAWADLAVGTAPADGSGADTAPDGDAVAEAAPAAEAPAAEAPDGDAVAEAAPPPKHPPPKHPPPKHPPPKHPPPKHPPRSSPATTGLRRRRLPCPP